MAAVVFLTFLFLISKVQSQIYGPYGPGIYPGSYGVDPGLCGPCADIYGPVGIPSALPNIAPIAPCNIPAPYQTLLNTIPAPSLIPNQLYPINQPLIAPCAPALNIPQLAPSIITNPAPQCASTPVVATTVVDNTLANSLANAIQLLIVSNLIENTLGSSCSCDGSNIAQALGFIDVPSVNNYEVVCPDFYPTPQVVSCDNPVINPYINDIPCQYPVLQEPVVYQPAYLDVPCNVNNYGPSIPIAPDFSNYGFNNCGCSQVVFDPCYNSLGPGSIPVPFSCEPAVATIPPLAVEVPFPTSIPANLICNFGYLPNNVPCVSVNVDPLPCNNFFGNFGDFVY